MSRELFGTDGVRAVAGEYPLDDETIVKIGRAAGAKFARPGEQIVVACDTRQSSPHIVEKIIEGLRGAGVRAVFAGVMPTPGLAHVTAGHAEFVAGIMITASHNLYEFNGIKIFTSDGGKLPDETETEITSAVFDGVADRDGGAYEERDLSGEYEDFLVSTVDDLRLDGLTIAFDGANGAAYAVGEEVLTRLGATVIALGTSPDGKNINDHCGATAVNALRDLVVSEHCDFGIAVDGDADRLMMIDHEGRICNGDHLLYILAVFGHYKRVVATVMTNLGTEQSLAAQGITLERTAVGDRYVLERLSETGLVLGGEQSGHVILARLATTGDGLLSALQVIEALQLSGKSLSEWRQEVQQLPQALVNFPINDKTKLADQSVIRFIEAETAKLGSNGRILIRPSGTEPLARVMVEGDNADELAHEIANRLQELVA